MRCKIEARTFLLLKLKNLLAMSQSQWKAYFSMFVLGQTDPFGNPAPLMGNDWSHQSCPWYAVVLTFQHKREHFYTDKEYCHCCGDPSLDYYCNGCESDKCTSCGELGCGSYMCTSCRQMGRY